MQAEIDKEGYLLLIPDNTTEGYALRQWRDNIVQNVNVPASLERDTEAMHLSYIDPNIIRVAIYE